VIREKLLKKASSVLSGDGHRGESASRCDVRVRTRGESHQEHLFSLPRGQFWRSGLCRGFLPVHFA
jgi:hypothetical protein